MSDEEFLEIGSTAPAFTLPATGGKTISLSDFRGDQHVVIFFMREFI